MEITPEQINQLIMAIKWIGWAIFLSAIIRACFNK